MNRTINTLRGEYFFQKDLLLYVNRATEDFSSPFHNHDFFECAYIAEGSGFHHIEDDVHKVQKGQLFFIPIGHSHVFRPSSTNKAEHPLHVYNCVFSPLLLHKMTAFTSDFRLVQFMNEMESGRLSYFSCHDSNDQFDKLFLTMHLEYKLRQVGSTDYLYALLLQLLIVLQRSADQAAPLPAPKQAAFIDLLHYMDNHYDQELTLTLLAQVSRWSERHLQRLFHQHTGQSFNRYLQNMRIQKSQELLRSSQFKISTIAEMVGYKDIHSFNTVFKRCTGMTPSFYRKEAVTATSPK